MNFVIVADSKKQRLALSETIYRLGFYVYDSLTSDQIDGADLPKNAVWLVDIDDYTPQMQATISMSSPKFVLMGFNEAPSVIDGDIYERWQRLLMRRLSELLRLSLSIKNKPSLKRLPWRYVVFIGASMGGPQAVKQFLDHLTPNLPIAIIIAHHYDETMIESLPKILTRQNDWRCQVIKTTQSLQAGMCFLAPIGKKIVCDSTGRIMLTRQDWQGKYRPNIGELLKNTSEVFGNQMIGIIFSGMGDDGSQYAHQLPVNNSKLWAQDPATCQSPSQPQAFIDTGVCQFIGSPKQMAEKINQMLGVYTSTSARL